MTEKADDQRFEPARAALHAHRDRLLNEYSATGVGVGLDDNGQPAIIVYMPTGKAMPARAELDGVPLVFKAVGLLKPM
jgi:hypothetical protein